MKKQCMILVMIIIAMSSVAQETTNKTEEPWTPKHPYEGAYYYKYNKAGVTQVYIDIVMHGDVLKVSYDGVYRKGNGIDYNPNPYCPEYGGNAFQFMPIEEIDTYEVTMSNAFGTKMLIRITFEEDAFSFDVLEYHNTGLTSPYKHMDFIKKKDTPPIALTEERIKKCLRLK